MAFGDKSELGRAVLDVVDDRAIVIAGLQRDAQEIDEIRLVLAQERTVAAASVHQLGRQLACKLGARLYDEAWQPGDAIDFICLGWDLVGIKLCRSILAAECVHEMISPQFRDALDLIVLDVAPLDAVLDEIEQLS